MMKRSLRALLGGFCVALMEIAMGQNRGIVGDFVVTQSRAVGEENRIEWAATGEYALDAEGRSMLSMNGTTMILDPVDGLAWEVDPVNGIAYEQQMRPPMSADETGVSASATPLPDGVSLNLPEAVVNGIEALSVVDLGDPGHQRGGERRAALDGVDSRRRCRQRETHRGRG